MMAAQVRAVFDDKLGATGGFQACVSFPLEVPMASNEIVHLYISNAAISKLTCL